MKRLPRVALLIETSREYGRGLLRGVIAYQRQHGPWSIFFRPHGLDEPAPRWLHQWHGQGILARINDRRMAETLSQCNVPVVDLRFAVPDLAIHNPKIIQGVGIDNYQVAQLAADHLLERGLRHFGFIGMPHGQNIWSDFRSERFVRLIEMAGYSCSVFTSRSGHHREGSYEHEQEEIIAWVRGLPKPVGVMASHDDQGQQLLDACRRADVRVPDEVAVLGVDNDEFLCNLSQPPLSSIALNAERIGWEAAALLDRLMNGRKVPRKILWIPPLRVVTRHSTDILAIDDQEVASALRIIRDRARHGVTVEEVLREVSLSRSLLERRMRQAIGRTPKEEILRLQLECVRELLAETNLSLKQIASRTGYKYPQNLVALFKKKFGQTPGVYRGSVQG
ncbi:MAG TPA: XylR family transcriptional regulator [Gemmataceae bacterium]|jgi:LacI family transcriptional regulator